MYRGRRGFAPVVLVLLIVVGIAVLGGAFYYFHKASPTMGNPPVVATSTTPTSTQDVDSLSPASGPVGTTVTIHGSGFAASGNQVTLNGMVSGSLKGLSSPDGKTITFVVPLNLGPNCRPDEACPEFLLLVSAGSYNVSVISNGVTQSIGVFTVTGGGLRAMPLQSQ